ncbi:MAG TPA: PTS mannitol transporter subunit IICBA [Candidatus Anaerobutyricum stercoripullorum]|uniref:Mannitol-specific phosphotransferase enzyme IIA component n=1 Tax=Candidatus Anaerobutyricum stercoripullorum TaxID=2838456 RepID=A0A9D2BDN4_9FIRM|nr:PTS mannitol transporter subunit IICBA [Candidatus Anaerobutyricum stercoripullorum]
MKNAVQRFGKFLSAMVMPNIGAFIAWGFITALFIEAGWLPNEQLASLNGPMLNYLLPILIGVQGGKLVGGDRGAVMGAIATVGVIVGAPDYPMLMGSMVMGPLAGFVIKKFDQAMDGRMPAGFEMLINNFSVGIFGMILAIIGFYAIGPLMSAILVILRGGVEILINNGLLPLAAIFIEPAKVLFLNNAINQGIFTPIGITQAAEAGKSIMYMLETNPGPGFGLLLAYWVFSKDRATKDSAPGAIIIQFLGGIHEIYFPYILMNPFVIIGPILGNICAIFFFSIMDAGLVGPAAPGSIIAFLAMSPRDSILISVIGVAIAAAVSFLVSSPIIRMAGARSLEDAQAQKDSMKAESKGAAPARTGAEVATDAIQKIIFACDAGMGSSAMGATKFRNRIKPLNLGITVTNTSVDNVPGDADVVVCQYILQDRAAQSAPQARLVTLGNFLQDPNLDALYAELEQRANGTSAQAEAAATEAPAEAAPAAQAPAEEPQEGGKKAVLVREGVRTGLASVSKEEAIRAAGELLNELGFVNADYIDAMLEREKLVSTYMGMGVAIPHGTATAKDTVKKSGIVVMQYPDGVDFGDEKAYLVIGIAGVGDEHLEILGRIVESLEDEELLEKLKKEADVDTIMKTFG